MFRLGLEKSLENSYFHVQATTKSLPLLPSLILKHKPQCAIIDLNLQGEQSGLSFLSLLSSSYPTISSLILTSNPLFKTALNCFELGAKGYLIKGSNSSQVLLALSTILNHALYLDPLLTHDFRSFCQQSRLEKERQKIHSISPLSELVFSQKEKDVLCLLALGLNNNEIGHNLRLSPNTVKSAITRIFSKLRVNNRTLAAIKAYQLGFLA
jgi:DNA-binding NarL/FixJ family response regulator